MKRWFLIRHCRYFWLVWRFARWWDTVGSVYWLTPNQNDLDYLDAVWRGEE